MWTTRRVTTQMLGTARETAWQHAPGDSAAEGKAAEAKLEPGDIVKFKGNVIYRGSIAIGTSGAAGKPIVYDGNADGDWGEGKAIIEGSLPLTNLQRCRNAQEAEGNPNYRHIYWTTVPKGANWKAINVCQGTTPWPGARTPIRQTRFSRKTWIPSTGPRSTRRILCRRSTSKPLAGLGRTVGVR